MNEIYLSPMTAEMYHEYFREYQNDLDLYIDNFMDWAYAEKFTISTLDMTKYEGRRNGKFYIYP